MERTIDKTAAMLLRNCILRNKLWATDEETAEWLKTETGQHIAALINERRKEIKADKVLVLPPYEFK